MPYPQFDRDKLHFKPLSLRDNRTNITQDHVPVSQKPKNSTHDFQNTVYETVERVKGARRAGRPVVLATGAHTIKNGMGPLLIKLMEDGWITHLASNGAGIIHDWEFAFQGASSEHVARNLTNGQFGIWDETCRYINLAINVGAFEGKGYGEAVGSMIEKEGVRIPSTDEITEIVESSREMDCELAASALDMLSIINKFNLNSGWLPVPFPYKAYSVQAAAFRLGVPFTGHPMFGHDIIYTHPMNHGAAVGRTALRDFLTFAHAINQMDNGVYLSVGSAVMSPMIFEKSLSMSQNLHIQENQHIDKHYILVVDLAESQWDWQVNGEPPPDHPAYYLRFCKTFSRMGGTMQYLQADNRDFFLALYQRLSEG